MSSKKCGACRETKALSEFSRKGQGHSSKCRSCQKAYWESWYAKPEKRAQHIASSQKNNKLDRVKIGELVAQAKDKPCADCGQKYPHYVMDFDHLPGQPKVSGVAAMRSNGSKKAILAEIAKCEVVCSNCHRERTHQRRKSGVIVQWEDTSLAS